MVKYIFMYWYEWGASSDCLWAADKVTEEKYGYNPAIEMVHRTVYNKFGKFTKSEVMELCPTISKASVENSIKQLVVHGLLLKHGSGRSTFYTRSDI